MTLPAWTPLISCCATAALLTITTSVAAQTADDQLIDELRREFETAADTAQLGVGYAAMINFAVNADISTASYRIDSEADDDPVLDVYRVPLRKVFDIDGYHWRPFVQLGFAYQTLDTGFELIPDEKVDSEWRAFGGSLATGAEIPLNESLTLIPAIDVGLIRLENDADYDGELSNRLLKPALKGVLFDWEADAWLAGATLGLDYQRDLGPFDLNVHGGLTHNYIETYDSSSDLIDFSGRVTTFAVQADTLHPTSWSLAGYPLALVLHVGNTTFLGSDRDAIGFDSFFEAGAALEADVSGSRGSLKSLRLGAKAIYGADVRGWSVIFGYQF